MGRAAASSTRHVQRKAGECHLVASPTEQDKVRELQRTLYRAAKADPGRRFHALYDKVYRRDVLERAWELVRRNRGAAGIDRLTIQQVELIGVDRLLDKLAESLKQGSWRPLPARRCGSPSPGRPSSDRCRFPRSATASCRRPSSWSSSRSSRPTCCRARSGSARGRRPMMPCRSSSMRRGGGGAGWSRRISPRALSRSRTTGWSRRLRNGSWTARSSSCCARCCARG
jgi:hypothetical protein